MDYMIYTKVMAEDGNCEYVYMFPKCLQVSAETLLDKLCMEL